MRFLKTALLSFAFLAFLPLSSQAQLREGQNYQLLLSPARADAGAKVEVIEVFGYFCPHCYNLDPMLKAWVAKMGDKIVFKRVHAGFGGKLEAQQRLYYTLEALGRLDLHEKAFQAVHLERKGLNDIGSATDFAVRYGIDKAKFLATWDSFAVVTAAQRASATETGFRLDGVPNLVVDGRYFTGLGIISKIVPRERGEEFADRYMLDVTGALVDKVLAERRAR